MYEAFFGLTRKPFELVPNPKFMFLSRSHRKAISYLKYGMRERAGFILLTGEVGSGKTTIIRDLIAGMDSDVVLAMVFNTKVTTKQILAMINEDFGLPIAGRDKIALLRELNDFLLEQHAQGKRPVVIVDEAQNLSPAALEEIRLLSNLEATDAKLLQIILVGQPELKEIIARHELRQLRQRISVHCHLDPLTREETEDYVLHRLELAGNRSAVIWGEGCFDVLFKYSHGIPRLINVFCDFILLAAHVEGTRTLDLALVEEVIGDTSWDRQVREQQLRAGHHLDERLILHEQQLAQLAEVAVLREELTQRLQSLEELLRDMRTRQDKNYRRMEATFERTFHQLQLYLAGIAAEEPKKAAATEVKLVEDNNSKALLRKLFS